MTSRDRSRWMGAAAAAVLMAGGLLGGCAVEWQNREPARQLAKAAAPQGSVYGGWRVFQARCASCHGADAAGLPGAGPNLLERVSVLGERRFVGLVLNRYDWGLPPQQADRNALVDDVVAGNAQLGVISSVSARKALEAGTVRVLAVSSMERLGGVFAGAPTWRELNVPCVLGQWRGLVGAPDIGVEHVAYWIGVLGEALQHPEWQEELAANCWSPEFITGDALKDFLDRERAFSAKMLRALELVS